MPWWLGREREVYYSQYLTSKCNEGYKCCDLRVSLEVSV
jgi:hypothetical protein